MIPIYIPNTLTHTHTSTFSDRTNNTYPVGGNILQPIPHHTSAMKLQRVDSIMDLTQEGKVEPVKRLVPWRTQENHMAEWLEIIWMYVPRNGLICDLTAGTCTSALAAMRLNHPIIVNDVDGDLLDVAVIRLKYYAAWLKTEYGGIPPGHKPHPCTYLNEYGFDPFLSKDQIIYMDHAITIPEFNCPYKWDHIDKDLYTQQAGLKIMQSTIPDAGKGCFLIKNAKAGHAFPYFGKYLLNKPRKSDRGVLLSQTRKDETDIYIVGHKDCPASFINDPTVSDTFIIVSSFIVQT